MKNSTDAKTYPSIANPNHSGLVLARFNIPTISRSPTTKIKGVSFTRAKKVLAMPGITSFSAWGKITKICIFQYRIPKDLSASC